MCIDYDNEMNNVYIIQMSYPSRDSLVIYLWHRLTLKTTVRRPSTPLSEYFGSSEKQDKKFMGSIFHGEF
jgi:hypothetical protein